MPQDAICDDDCNLTRYRHHGNENCRFILAQKIYYLHNLGGFKKRAEKMPATLLIQ